MTNKYKSLLRDRDALDAQIAEYYGAMRLDAIDAARQLVKQHELKLGDLFPPERLPKARYQNPKTGETWSGRGRTPRWIEGLDRKQFEI